MKKKPIIYSGTIDVNLPPDLHAKVSALAKQSGVSIPNVLAVLLAMQFPIPALPVNPSSEPK